MLVPNAKGLERALAANARSVAVFTAVSETFNQKNIGMGVDESFGVFEPVVREAKAKGLWVRGYLSTVFGCPYEGRVDPVRAAGTATRLWELGVDEVSLGDTIGVATPAGVGDVLGAIGARIPRAAIIRSIEIGPSIMPSFRELPKEKLNELADFLSSLH